MIQNSKVKALTGFCTCWILRGSFGEGRHFCPEWQHLENHSSNNAPPPPPPKKTKTMTVRANKFTPEVLLSAPRRTAATPNADGTLALFTVSTYSFQTHSKTNEIRALDIKTGQTTLLVSDLGASEPTWLGEGNLVLWLKGGEKGTTNLVLADAENLENK
jgi:hypothetical protein